MYLKRLVLVVCFVLLFSSCEGRLPSCYELYSAISFEKVSVEVYPYQSDLTCASFFSRLYYGEKRDAFPDEFKYCDDYYIAMSDQIEPWEIHIFHVASGYDVFRVSDMLAMRKERLQKENALCFYSDEGRERISAARIFTVGNYVILSVTDCNDLVERSIRNLI